MFVCVLVVLLIVILIGNVLCSTFVKVCDLASFWQKYVGNFCLTNLRFCSPVVVRDCGLAKKLKESDVPLGNETAVILQHHCPTNPR
jgi:hypothetical protein